MVTGVNVAILDPDPDMPDWLWTVTYYDDYGREIQTQADNHLGGSDITWYEYDFVGQMLFSKHEHIGHDGSGSYGAYERSATIYKSYTYDPQGRLIRTEQKTEDPENIGQETEFVTLSQQDHNKIGQTTNKNLHYKSGDDFLQLGNYEYNIRGWMTAFNNPSTTTPSGPYRDLFSMSLRYNTDASSIFSGATHQYNGNISAMTWQTLGRGNEIRAYTFSYDKMNRLLDAKYREKTGSNWNVNIDRYRVHGITYDMNGNIQELKRQGKDGTGTNAFGLMDDLDYDYSGNHLTRVSDDGYSNSLAGVEQFVDGNTSGDDYFYDANGNMVRDKNKGITTDIEYNHFNKPTSVFLGSNELQYIYSADGTKLRQKAIWSSEKITDYLGAFHYEDADGSGSSQSKEMLFFSHEEGRVRIDAGVPLYETFIRDHLGNNRIMFADMNEDGWVDPASEVLQETHVYPFGLTMAGASSVATPAIPNYYLFTGKETQNEFGLGWIDFGARMYDASVGRWNGVDIQAERYSSISPYAYVANNPMIFVDPNGEEIWISYVDSEGNTQQARYESGTVYDKKGNKIDWAYHSSEFLKNTVASLSIIQNLGGDRGKELISGAEKSELKVTIQYASPDNIEHRSDYDETTGEFREGIIGFNPDWGTVVDGEGSIQAPMMSLVDELGHFMDSHNYTKEEMEAELAKKDSRYGNPVERRNMENYVNPIAIHLGNPLYLNHYGPSIAVQGGVFSRTPMHEINKKEGAYIIKKELEKRRKK